MRRQVHLVFVFDELDKLDDGTPATPETNELSFSLMQGDPAVHSGPYAGRPTQGSAVLRRPKASSAALATTAAVIRQLKILFSTSGVSAIVIGGRAAEEQCGSTR